MKHIENLKQAAEVLEARGYDTVAGEEAVYTTIGGKRKPFVAVLTINPKNELVITCQVAMVGDFDEDKFAETLFNLLDLNTEIRPYAFGILTANDDPELYEEVESFPIVLTDSLPLGDLSDEELQKSMDSLLIALQAGRAILKQGLKKK